MVTEARQVTQPPKGSISLQHLLRALHSMGLKKYSYLGSATIKDYSLLALFYAFKQYGPKSFCYSRIWNRISIGDTCADFFLLPDTEQARLYNGTYEDSLLMAGRTNVFSTLARIFVSVVREDETKWVRQAARLEQTIMEANGQDHRLAAYFEEFRMQYDETNGREALEIAQQVLEKMRPRDALAIELLFDLSANEVAERLNMTVTNIYAIRRKFRNECKELRSRPRARTQGSPPVRL